MTCVMDFPMLPSVLGFVEELVSVLFCDLKVANKPFLSCLLLLFQKESWCTSVFMEMHFDVQDNEQQDQEILISIFTVVYQDSLCNRFNNGLLVRAPSWN